MNQWISGSFAIVGVLVGGLLSYLAGLHKTNIENEWKRDEGLLKKFEELYATTEEIKDAFFNCAGRGIAKAHYNTPIPEMDKIPIGRLKALIDFYAPEAAGLFIKFEERRGVFGGHYAKVVTTTSFTKPEAQLISQHLLESSTAIESACKDIQDRILDISRSLRVTRVKSLREVA